MKTIRFAAIMLEHNHIYDMCRQLVDAGAELVSVFDPDPTRLDIFVAKFPDVRIV